MKLLLRRRREQREIHRRFEAHAAERAVWVPADPWSPEDLSLVERIELWNAHGRFRATT